MIMLLNYEKKVTNHIRSLVSKKNKKQLIGVKASVVGALLVLIAFSGVHFPSQEIGKVSDNLG